MGASYSLCGAVDFVSDAGIYRIGSQEGKMDVNLVCSGCHNKIPLTGA
jgi:hypothetical protein